MEITSYYDIMHNANTVNMNIYEMAYAEVGAEWLDYDVCSNYTRIYMIIDGCGEITYNGITVKLMPGNVYVIPSGLTFSYSCDSYMKKVYFHMALTFYENLDLLKDLNTCIVLKNQNEVIGSIADAISTNTFRAILDIKNTLSEIVNACVASPDTFTQPIPEHSELVTNALSFINANLSASLSVSEVAGEMYVSVSKLQKIFKRETGISLGRYIDDRLMLTVEQELRIGTKTIKEISETLGFCDQFYMSRKFRQHYGISPMQYKHKFNSGYRT